MAWGDDGSGQFLEQRLASLGVATPRGMLSGVKAELEVLEPGWEFLLRISLRLVGG